MSYAAISSDQAARRSSTSKLVSAALAAVVLVGTAAIPAAAGQFMAETPDAATLVRLSPLHSMTGFRRVSVIGQTKPPGAALDRRNGTSPALDAQSHRLDQLIGTSICSRC